MSLAATFTAFAAERENETHEPSTEVGSDPTADTGHEMGGPVENGAAQNLSDSDETRGPEA